MTIPWAESEIPSLTTEQIIEVDRAMIEDFAIDLTRMMENAGRCLADLARRRFLGGDPRGKRVGILAGSGGNGGGAMVAARRLHGYGADVTVFLTRDDLSGVPADQAKILEAIGVALRHGEVPAGEWDLAIDGIIGYSLRGAPRGVAAELISWLNTADLPVLSLDVPSGIAATSGEVPGVVVRASATMTLALPKHGLTATRHLVGELYVADISVPPGLYASPPLNLAVGPIFARGDVIRLT